MLRALWPFISPSLPTRTTTSILRARVLTRYIDSAAAFPSEAASPHKSIYDQLSKHDADVVARVATSLPELLPEPETDPGSVFEDKDADSDYQGVVSVLSPFTSTEALERLVKSGSNDMAVKLLDEILAAGISIPTSHTYQLAVISTIRDPASTPAVFEEQVQLFRRWFSLLPTANESRPGALNAILHQILYPAVPSLRLIVEFGLLAATKGFGPYIKREIVSFVCAFAEPNQAIEFLNGLCRQHESFLGDSLSSRMLATRFRRDATTTAVRVFIRAGRIHHALQLVLDSYHAPFRIDSGTTNYLLLKLRELEDPELLPQMEALAKRGSVAALRSAAIHKVDAPTIAHCVRCLVDVGAYEMAVDLFPHLRDASSDLMMETFEYIRAPPTGTRRSVAEEFARYDLALRTFTQTWCLDEALAVLPALHRANTKHGKRAYLDLLSRLKASHDSKYDDGLHFVGQLIKQLAAQRRASAQQLVELLPAGVFDALASPSPSISELAQILRALKASLRSPSPSHQPTIATLVAFMQHYTSLSRSRAIALLRNYVSASPSARAAYGLAHMLLHQRTGQPAEVIRTYASYFIITGLPRDELLAYLGSESSYFPTKQEPWLVHNAAVWHALLDLTPVQPYRESNHLYNKMLSFGRYETVPPPTTHHGVPYLDPPWECAICAGAFTPFIRRLTVAYGAQRGLDILQDMNHLGIDPQIHQLTEVAMAFSREGDVPQTFTLLNLVERAFDAQVDESKEHDVDDLLYPSVDIVFYAAIIRGLFESGKLDAAKDVVRRLLQRFGTVVYENEIVRELLAQVVRAGKMHKVS
ncbi:hypothetical protein HMN09_00232200 [Mycena chlorophos]|uniref:Pentatricopeptide repeat-containing protein n=1 Tax=Mycena chlorophos TaxID=658473 RepID=A0A8H6WLD0_MYCCL|nr:hypothetical protein HMN09_00232200 [Mycena chlorophos]